MKAAQIVLALVVSLIVCSNLQAAEEKGGPEGKHPHQARMDRWAVLSGVSLTDEQKTQVEAVKQEYGSKFKEARSKIDGILTDEQRKVRDEAVKAARAAGKRGEEVWKDAKAAVTLTDEQKTKMADARRSVEALRKEAREKLLAILTPEQKEHLHRPHQERPGHAAMGHDSEMLDCLNLTEEQKAKIAELKKEYGPKIADARKATDALRNEVHEKILAQLTPEQKAQLQQKREHRREYKPDGE